MLCGWANARTVLKSSAGAAASSSVSAFDPSRDPSSTSRISFRTGTARTRFTRSASVASSLNTGITTLNVKSLGIA